MNRFFTQPYPFVLALVLVSLTSACGYRLPGGPSIPAELNISCNARLAAALCAALEQQARLSGITLSENAPVRLSVVANHFKKRTGLLSPTGTTAEFVLHHETTIKLTQAQHIKASDTRYEAMRQFEQWHAFRNDARNVLGKTREEDETKALLTERMARDIIYALSSELAASLPSQEPSLP